MSSGFLSIYETERELSLSKDNKKKGSFRKRIQKTHFLFKSLLLITVVCIPMILWQHTLGRELLAGAGTITTHASKTEHDLNLHGCRYGVAIGADRDSTRGMLALIHSVITNYKPLEQHTLDDAIHDTNNLCVFVFSKEDDFLHRKRSLHCAFGRKQKNIKIIHKIIDKKHWLPRIYSTIEERNVGMEYKWFRYYLTPNDVDGLSRILYLDTDMIVQGNIAELFDWEMNGHVVAATSYWEPLRNHLCQNHRLGDIPMKSNELGLLGRTKTTTPFEAANHINTGLLLIDLGKMSKRQILTKWSNLVDMHENIECMWLELYSGEADFTLAINGDSEVLPEEWNVGNLGIPEKYRLTDGCERAKILHWNGDAKPYTSSGRTRALCSDYYDIYDMIPKMQQRNPECFSF